MKVRCIRDVIYNKSIYFNSGKVYDVRVYDNDNSRVSVYFCSNRAFRFYCSVERSNYTGFLIYEDYFISLEDYRESQIDKLL